MDEQAVTDDVFSRRHSNNSQTNGRPLKPRTDQKRLEETNAESMQPEKQ